MSATTLPNDDHVQSLLTNLFGDDVAVRSVDTPASIPDSSVRASYVNDEGVISKLLVCDLPFALRVGAALTMVPKGTVDEALKSGDIPKNIEENLHEVLNICVNLFPSSNGGRVVLEDVALPGGHSAPSNESNAAETVAFEVEIPRQGPGMISLMTVA